jgi:tetratricopeptide (TPR) repeat protein
MKRLSLYILFLLFIVPGTSSGEEFHESQLNRGIKNSEIYSSFLIKKAEESKTGEVDLLRKARLYSPDSPAVYFKLSKSSLFSCSILDSIDYFFKGISAYGRNFWWSFSLTGTLFISLILSFILALIVVVIIRLFSDIQLISHDILESPSRTFLIIALIPLSIISPLLLFAGILILISIYMRNIDKSVVILFLAFLIFSPLIFKTISLFMNTSSSSTIKSVVEVNEYKGNKYAISSLRNNDDYKALFSYGLALKREGYYREAIGVFNRLIKHRQEPRVYVNLGNCYFGLGNLEEAAKYYFMAIELRPLASAYYNLSQLSRETFNFEKGNEYFDYALALDRGAVSRYRSIYGRHPNRLIADETLDYSELWDYAMGKSQDVLTFRSMIVPAPVVSFLSLALLVAFFVLNKQLKLKASRCRRCNIILCTKCEKHLMWGQMCPQCYRSLVKLEELDSKERLLRLQSIYDHQKKRRDVLRIASFFLPGSALILGGEILNGFLNLWFFLFFLSIPFTSSIFTADTALFSHIICESLAVLIAIAIYIVSNFMTRNRIQQGWL